MSESFGISLVTIFEIIWKKKIQFSSILLVFLLFEVLILNSIPGQYKCESTIRILNKNDYNPFVFLLENTPINSESEFEASASKITIYSINFLDEIVTKLNLEKRFFLEKIKDSKEKRIAAINKLKSKITIKDLQSDNLLQIKVTDEESQLAYDITITLLNLFQERKIKELNKKNEMISQELGNSIQIKRSEIENLKYKLSEIRLKYKIISNGKNLIGDKNIKLTTGLYQNIDQVFDYENQLDVLSQALAKDNSNYIMISNFKKSNYPVYEIIEEPTVPLNKNNYNSPVIYILIFIFTFFVTTFIILIPEFKKSN